LHETASAPQELHGLSVRGILRFGRTPRVSLRVTAAACAACVLPAILLAIALHRHPGSAKPVIGRFLQVGGTVRATVGADHTSIVVRDSQTIRGGDRIVCDSDVRSLIELTDGTLVSLEGGSAVTVERNRSDDIEIFVEQGRALFEVAEQDPDEHCVIVRTPQATATVLGTLFSIEAQPTWTRTGNCPVCRCSGSLRYDQR
jgi:ferric-dicitrate binding protein FerR (iron transport regulator)